MDWSLLTRSSGLNGGPRSGYVVAHQMEGTMDALFAIGALAAVLTLLSLATRWDKKRRASMTAAEQSAEDAEAQDFMRRW